MPRPRNTTIDITDAAQKLKNGECVAIPTETVYGLAADIRVPHAVDSIFKIKKRPFFDPLIVHISKVEQVLDVAQDFPPLAQKLAEEFWPGPLTMVLPKNQGLNSKITSGLESVGVRLPAHPMAQKIIEMVGGPLAAPSANIFGRTSPTTAQHVIEEFGGSVSVVDGGQCEIGLESTVIGFDSEFKRIFIYRPGYITQKSLEKFAPVEIRESPAAPGQIKHHYMPKVPLVVLKGQSHLTEDIYQTIQTELELPILRPYIINLSPDPTIAARELYSTMRKAVNERSYVNCLVMPYDHTINERSNLDSAESAEPTHSAPPEQTLAEKSAGSKTMILSTTTLWSAITDRITKAATLVI